MIMECNGTTLIKAIIILEERHGKAVQSIEFEDGSGYCYNVKFAGETRPDFVKIDKNEFTDYRL